MTRTLVRMLTLLVGQGPETDLLLRQVPVRFPVVSSQTLSAFQKLRNEYEIGPQGGRGAHARIRTGDLFLTKEMLYRLSYVGGAAASRFYRAWERLHSPRGHATHHRQDARTSTPPARVGRAAPGRCRAGTRRAAGRYADPCSASRAGEDPRRLRDRS